MADEKTQTQYVKCSTTLIPLPALAVEDYRHAFADITVRQCTASDKKPNQGLVGYGEVRDAATKPTR